MFENSVLRLVLTGIRLVYSWLRDFFSKRTHLSKRTHSKRLFVGIADCVFMLFGVLPDSNEIFYLMGNKLFIPWL